MVPELFAMIGREHDDGPRPPRSDLGEYLSNPPVGRGNLAIVRVDVFGVIPTERVLGACITYGSCGSKKCTHKKSGLSVGAVARYFPTCAARSSGSANSIFAYSKSSIDDSNPLKRSSSMKKTAGG